MGPRKKALAFFPKIKEVPMRRNTITRAAVVVLALGFATAAYAVSGEFDNMCAEGLAMHKEVQTDCAISGQVEGKTLCFGSEQAKTDFMKDPGANLKEAQKFYSSLKG